MALRLFTNEIQAANKLRCIKSSKSWGDCNKAGLEKRIEFLATLFRNNLCSYVRNYDLFDEFGVGERDFDTCFEMHDGDEVIKGLMLIARDESAVKNSIIRDMGQDTFDRWNAMTPKTQDMFE
jgi:hypothetical protein|tara:strand:- start:4362 stop:4730 length:369 start_codon:yes stop_codon:yes gene_type:complete